MRKRESQSDLLLVCSAGGHLLQLVALRDVWSGFSRTWVSFEKEDVLTLLAGEEIAFAYGPTSRYYRLRAARSFVQNLVLAWQLTGRLRPRVVLTTGASVAVPFAWIARFRGARVVYVESFTRIESPSLSCRLIAPVAARIYAQWPELVPRVRRARYAGSVFSWTGSSQQ